MQDLLIIDADGHVSESMATLKKYMPEEYRHRPIQEGEAWDRRFGGTLGKHNEDPHVQLEDMDAEGIDVQVIFPTSGLSLSRLKETDLAVERARAYNTWLAEFCAVNPDRLKGVAIVALQDVDAAIKEARRAVEELHLTAVMMPTNVRDTDIGKKEFWPFYEEVQRLGVALAVHGGIHASERTTGRFDTFISVHALAFPLECMLATTGLIFAGVPEVFPELKIAILEGCCGWLPFLMDRMDEEFEKRGWREAPLLKRKPSEYLASGQFYYGLEIEESMLPYVIERVGLNQLVYASDYPHWDTSWPHTVEHFLGRTDLTDAQKRTILGENPQRLYGFEARVPAGSA
jgi:predicted TIM-barrel fold metal-dependent hydrolase